MHGDTWSWPGLDAPAHAVDAAVVPLLLGASLLSFCVACFGAFSAACLAAYSPAKLQNRNRREVAEHLLEELASRDREYQVVARFCALGGVVLAFLALQVALDDSIRLAAMAILGGLVLFACGVLPSAVAEVRAESMVLAALPMLRSGLLLLRWPVVLPILALTRGALWISGIRAEPKSDPAEVAEEDLPAEERSWIGNILNLKDQQVAAVMTPRTEIVALQADLPVREALALAARHGFSRYPVYGEKVEDVVGAFHVKDALNVADPTTTVRQLMRPPAFVPETMGLAQLLRKFQAEKLHLAVVLDEFGGTAGLISVEDVLEQIVGDIGDEYDAADAADPADMIAVVEVGRVLEVPGGTTVEEINRRLGTELPEDGEWETVAGYVISELNRIPAAGESLQRHGVAFLVLAADDRRLARLRVTALQPAPLQRDA
jgi:CBS domain containing-hemolysin-like protein